MNITKAQAGYICNPETHYLCGECQFLKMEDRCAYFGPNQMVSQTTGSCNRFKAGETDTAPWLKPFLTKVELGYMENAEGFGCQRCEEFKVGRDACKKVDRDSPGDTPGKIKPRACCDFWEADGKRAKMTDGQLVQLMADSTKRAPATESVVRGSK